MSFLYKKINSGVVDKLKKIGKILLIVKLVQRLLKNYRFSLQTSLFLYVVLVAPVTYNTTLILHGNNAWMFASRIRN